MPKAKKVAYAVVLTALAVALSPLFIPVGVAKVFPAQHMINVIAGVILGPLYALSVAFGAGLIRNLLGIGTLLAFPGGMIGAFLAGLGFNLTRNIYVAALGEVVGTGLLGASLSAVLVAPVFMGKAMALSALIVAFSISTVAGSIIGLICLVILKRAAVISY